MTGRAVFLDKDGTLVENVPYNVDSESLRLAGGAAEGLRAFCRAGYALIVVSNQSGVARGYFPERALREVEKKLRDVMASEGVELAGFYYCPHHPDATVDAYRRSCDCRKPMPGLILSAALRHDIDLSRSWVVGDILDDIEAGHRAGCRAILIDGGNETEWVVTPARTPEHITASLAEAADVIVGKSSTAATEGRP